LKNWGIQTRILLLALAPAVAVAGALSVYFVLALLSDLDRDLRDRGLGLARQLAAIAEYSTYSGDRQTLGSVALAALEEAHVNSVEVYDQEGEALAASGALPAPLSPLPSLTQSDVIHEDEDHLRIAAPVLALLTASFFIVLLAENCRVPADDPNTHLELTMIHEVMVLDHSGPDLAYILYGAALKLWLFAALIGSTVLPRHSGSWAADSGLFLLMMLGLAAAVGVVESVIARLRLTKVPYMLITAFAFSALALIFQMGR